MAILNYTTTIDASKTMGEIQAILARHGALQVITSYGAGGQPEGIAFMVPTQFGNRPFMLPANIAAVEKTLVIQQRKGKVPRRLANREQATRVAWRILKDWIEAQMAIVEAGMVTIDEVMLPYLQGDGGVTLYQFMQDQQLSLPAPNKGTHDK